MANRLTAPASISVATRHKYPSDAFPAQSLQREMLAASIEYQTDLCLSWSIIPVAAW
ncbi:hypothetical protein K432DRAFT_379006 [Lepidopterella palustris CBS 459.81]|uniref:Uncharacterized protein n=1 Tax=Lepidopterella palustris CBS 459.81 TaxID=1314670 RepID=A0A8E2EH81_9PEZI|nr:hypothetical protein K432DRAFT_379006 [Lepidopterella palustris CBS 459.81]